MPVSYDKNNKNIPNYSGVEILKFVDNVSYFLLGVPFSFGAKNEGTETLYTTGELRCSVAWAINEQGELLVPPSTQEQGNMF